MHFCLGFLLQWRRESPTGPGHFQRGKQGWGDRVQAGDPNMERLESSRTCSQGILLACQCSVGLEKSMGCLGPKACVIAVSSAWTPCQTLTWTLPSPFSNFTSYVAFSERAVHLNQTLCPPLSPPSPSCSVLVSFPV